MNTIRFSRSIALAMTLGTIAVASLVQPQAAAADAPAVQLYYGRINWVYNDAGGIGIGYNLSGYVAVRPSSLPQSVTIHYTYGGGVWSDVAATFVRTAPDGYQVYGFQAPNTYPSFHYYNFGAQFAIRYQEGNTTIWDNNGGQDYVARSTNVPVAHDHPFVLSRSALMQEGAWLCYGGGVAGGQIILKNLAYQKDVRVRYSYDNWKTTHEVAAVYANGFANDAGVVDTERWSFSFPDVACNSSISSVAYAISYTVNGTVYWLRDPLMLSHPW